jgi:histidine decarboxylase
LSPLFLWSAIRKLGRSGFREMAIGCMKMADYAIERFRKEGIEAWRNNNSVTVVFPRPAAAVAEKWQIAVSNDIGHIITMPHVTRQLVDEFVGDIAGNKQLSRD